LESVAVSVLLVSGSLSEPVFATGSTLAAALTPLASSCLSEVLFASGLDLVIFVRKPLIPLPRLLDLSLEASAALLVGDFFDT